jgi:hypothetical protein
MSLAIDFQVIYISFHTFTSGHTSSAFHTNSTMSAQDAFAALRKNAGSDLANLAEEHYKHE